MFKLFLTLILCISYNHVFGAIIEKYTDSNLCDLNDAETVNLCLKKAIQSILPKLNKGIRDIDMVPVNPLYVPLANLNENSKGPTSLSLVLKDTKHTHINEGKVIDLKFTEKEKLFFRVSIPKLNIDGNYKVKGKILALPIFGDGKTAIQAVNNSADINIVLKQNPGKDGKVYLKAEEVYIKVTPGKISFLFENLLNNKELSDGMNKFLNENSEEILKEILPSLNAMYTQILKGIVNKIFASHPAEEFIKT